MFNLIFAALLLNGFDTARSAAINTAACHQLETDCQTKCSGSAYRFECKLATGQEQPTSICTCASELGFINRTMSPCDAPRRECQDKCEEAFEFTCAIEPDASATSYKVVPTCRCTPSGIGPLQKPTTCCFEQAKCVVQCPNCQKFSCTMTTGTSAQSTCTCC